jgi:hypothetical protein
MTLPEQVEGERMSGQIDDLPSVEDKDFMENVREALGNGYDRCCAHCGVGTAGDDMDIHERACPEWTKESYGV